MYARFGLGHCLALNVVQDPTQVNERKMRLYATTHKAATLTAK